MKFSHILLHRSFTPIALFEAFHIIRTIEEKIVQQQKENQELQAEVEKLSRYERIAEVAKNLHTYCLI
jgi:cell division protein FtsL